MFCLYIFMPTDAWKKENIEKLRQYRREHYYRNREHYIEESKKRKEKLRNDLINRDEQLCAYLKTHPSKLCSACNSEKPISEFYLRSSGGRRYPNHECAICQNLRRSKGTRGKVDRLQQLERSKQYRRNPLYRAKFIVADCKKSDKRYKRKFDLDVEFVEALIANGCAYCGDTANLMTLDRIDNAVGHTKANVNPACYRCNDLRSDMPYEAWTALAPTVKTIHEQGLFETWRFKGILSATA